MPRTRIGSIKLLPAEADEDVAWALDQVVSRESMTQRAAFAALNDRLSRKGLTPTTSSSFNRLVIEVRVHGIPPRYRLPTTPDSRIDALTALIDSRIEAALAKRGIGPQP
jgi:hypothetical protein